MHTLRAATSTDSLVRNIAIGAGKRLKDSSCVPSIQNSKTMDEAAGLLTPFARGGAREKDVVFLVNVQV